MFSTGKVKLDVTIMQTTGEFEIGENGSLTASGRISLIEESSQEMTDTLCDRKLTDYELMSSDIYKELRLRGYDYGPDFRGIHKTDLHGNYIYFIMLIDYQSNFDIFS